MSHDEGPTDEQGLLPLADDEVHVWVTRPGHSCVPPSRYEALLTPEEEKRYRSFRFEKHREEYLTTRALLHAVLARYLPTPDEGFRFVRSDFGKPRLHPASVLGFNLSNHPSLVVCGIARDQELGVDVEPLDRAEEILEVAETVFSEREHADLAALDGPDRRERAVLLWTLKEAYIKARGAGLSLPLQEFSMIFGEDGSIAVHFDATFDRGPWAFASLRHGEHRVSIARRAAVPLRVHVSVVEDLVPFAERGSASDVSSARLRRE